MSDSEQQREAPPKRERGGRRARARQIVAARLERLEDLSVSKLVPSTLTLMGLCSGATAIRFALMAEWKTAVTCVVFGGPSGVPHVPSRVGRNPSRRIDIEKPWVRGDLTSQRPCASDVSRDHVNGPPI